MSPLQTDYSFSTPSTSRVTPNYSTPTPSTSTRSTSSSSPLYTHRRPPFSPSFTRQQSTTTTTQITPPISRQLFPPPPTNTITTTISSSASSPSSPSPSTSSPSSPSNLSYPRYILAAMAASLPSANSILRTPPPIPDTPMLVDQAESSSSPSRRSRSREFWSHLAKNLTREECEDEPMPLAEEEQEPEISLTFPPSLPKCSLSADFKCSNTHADIPPAFYPGQAIPTVLTFQLDRYSSLPHAFNPVLTMSLIGTLHTPKSSPRTIICVSVSLSQGLALWARDAKSAYAHRRDECPIDPDLGLPGGTYSLPLTVQVPSTPRLPPSFTVDGSSFAVTYALTVTLTCNDPYNPSHKAVLAEASRPFDMMPETLPTRTPRYGPQSFNAYTDGKVDGVVSAAKGLLTSIDESTVQWTVQPSLPTTAFSPTSQIPLSILLTPPVHPDKPTYHVIIRMALLRREHLTTRPEGLRDPAGSSGLIKEDEITTRYAWFETTGEPLDVQANMPLMLNGNWDQGYSTVLNVGPPPVNATEGETAIAVSSTFSLTTVLAFLQVKPDGPTLQDLIDKPLPPMNTWTPAVSAKSPSSLGLRCFRRNFSGCVRMLPLPIVIGSVSEPRGAMHQTRWSDLHLDHSSGTEVGRMIYGEGLTSENGWILPPPAYGEAVEQVPYEYY